jgi:hypothetical protein
MPYDQMPDLPRKPERTDLWALLEAQLGRPLTDSEKKVALDELTNLMNADKELMARLRQ